MRETWFALILALCCATASAAAPTKVMVTVDVESYQQGNPDRQIWGKQPDGEHGIRRIMDLLDRHGFKGTFYLNVYEAAKHGEPAIAEVARVIHQRGHDLQLHTHPGPMYGFSNMQHADLAQQEAVLLRGKELILAWTGKTVVAHRAGAYAANLDTLKASRAARLAIDSSFSPASPNTMLARQLPASNWPSVIDGIVELPVSYYTQLRFGNWRSQRILDIEASSLDEFQSVLRQFRDGGAPVVNIMMHSFSFVRFGVANPALEQRFDRLLAFLAQEPGFEVITVSQLHPTWTSQLGALKPDAGLVPHTGLWLTYWRAVEHAGEGGANLMVALAPAVVAGVAAAAFFILRRRTRSKKAAK